MDTGRAEVPTTRTLEGGAAEVQAFVHAVRRNPHVRTLLDHWHLLQLPDCWLVAGCLFQTLWNLREGRPAEENIRDCDLFYFDADDLGEAAEMQVQQQVDRAFADLGISVEAKNQARVHLWYPGYFGHPYPALGSAREGIDRFLVLETCVGLRPSASGGKGWDLYAPNGLQGLHDGWLSPNPLTDHPALFEAKAASYRARWPWLRVRPVERNR